MLRLQESDVGRPHMTLVVVAIVTGACLAGAVAALTLGLR